MSDSSSSRSFFVSFTCVASQPWLIPTRWPAQLIIQAIDGMS
jgi:hypothetical protein